MASLGGGALLAGCAGEEANGNGEETGGTDSDNGGNGGGTDDEALPVEAASMDYIWPLEEYSGQTLEEEYNLDMTLSAMTPGPDEVLQMFVAGDAQQFDAVQSHNSVENLLGRENALASIDKDRIEEWDRMQDHLKEDGEQSFKLRHDGELLAAPCTQNADSLTYNRDRMDTPNSWGVLFDEQWRGETAVIDDWANTLCWTALYCRENNIVDIDNPSDMTAEEVEGVIDFLVENKEDGQFVTIWSAYGNTIDLLVNEELAASYVFFTAVLEAREQGIDLGYPTLREGHYEWNDNWHMTNGCVERGNEEQFYRIANYALSEKYAADMLQTRAAHTTRKFDDVQDYIMENDDEYDVDLLMDRFEATQERYDANGDTFAWNNMDPDAREAYTDGWGRFLNA